MTSENGGSPAEDREPKQDEGAGAGDVRRTLGALLAPGDVIELRALGVARGRSRGTASGYFDKVEDLVTAAEMLDGRAGGIYVTLNPVKPALLARAANRIVENPEKATSDGEIVRRRWLLLDADPVRPSGISSTNEEKALAFAFMRDAYTFLKERGFPEPVKGDSGNGAHMLYAVDLAADDGGLVQRVLDALAFRFNTSQVVLDQSVHKRAQLTKLYGTLVRKGDNTPERPHRRSRLISVPDVIEVVPRELLEAIAAQSPPGKGVPPDGTDGTRTRNGPFDVEGFLLQHGLAVTRIAPWQGGTKWVLNVCPFNSEHTNGSAFILRFPSGAVDAGCHHNGCNGKRWHELRDILEPGWRERGPQRQSRSTGSQAPAKPRAKRVKPFVPFPVDALPEPLRAYVTVASKAIGCDPTFIALPLLAALAGAIGNSRRLRLTLGKHGWTEPPTLWTAIIGDSGSGKSPALSLALRTVYERQRRALDAYNKELERYEEDCLTYEVELRKWKKRGEGAPPEKPVRPTCHRVIVSDTTVESLVFVLNDNPRGLMSARDELSGWLASFNQYKKGQGSDVANWLEMHRSGTVIVDRKSSAEKTLFVSHASVSITGGIQPQILARALRPEFFECGLAARLLVAYPPRIAKRWSEATIPDELGFALDTVLSRLYALSMEKDEEEGEPRPVLVDLAPEAKELFIAFYNELGEALLERSSALAAMWSKIEAYCPRFALIFHLLREAASDTTVGEKVDEHSMVGAITLARWFGHEGERVYALLGEDEELRDLRALAERVKRKGGTVTVRDWQRSRDHATAAEAEAELQQMVDAGFGSIEQKRAGEKGGRAPSPVFRLVPSGVTDRTSEGAAETGTGDTADGGSSVVSVSGAESDSQHGGAEGDPVAVTDSTDNTSQRRLRTSRQSSAPDHSQAPAPQRSDSEPHPGTDTDTTDETPAEGPGSVVSESAPEVLSGGHTDGPDAGDEDVDPDGMVLL